MPQDFSQNFIRRGLALFLFIVFISPLSHLAAQESAAAPGGRVQKTIELLEDEERRQEVITLLKLMADLEEQPALDSAAGETPGGLAPAGDVLANPKGVGAYLRNLTGRVWQGLTATGPGLRQTWGDIKKVFHALGQPWAIEIWRPYFLKAFIWGLACLIAIRLIIRKCGQSPAACFSGALGGRLNHLFQYLLIVAGLSLALILPLLALPELSTTAPGVTADLATGFVFIHALIQHFFINLSVLYISLEVAGALLTPNSDGRSLINTHPVLSRYFLNSWRVFAVYVAIFIFLEDVFLAPFVNSVLYTGLLVLMTLPLPIYLTFRLIKLKRLVHLISEAEASAGRMEEAADALANSEEEGLEPTAEPPAHIDYPANIFIKKHWASLALVSIWVLTLISLINPADSADHFGIHLLGTAVLLVLGIVAIRLIRRLGRRLAAHDTADGHSLALQFDSLTNFLVWTTVAIVTLVFWGFPLISFFENQITREILGRAFTIVVVVIAVGIFIRFSRVTTEWLLAVPNLGQNRNWRTMTPLVLAAARSLAVFIGVVVILERLGVNVGPVLAGAGILGLGVGMGAQSLVKDVINGVTILFMDTLAVGDWVVVGGKSGTVEAVGLRTIRLRDSSGNLTVVPNSSVDTIVNMTKDYSQDLVEFTVPYDADPDQMLQLAGEVVWDLNHDPQWTPYLTSPAAVVGVVGFDANGTTIRLKINTISGHQWSVGRELRLRLKRGMLKAGLKSASFGQSVFIIKDEPGEAQPPAADGQSEPDRANSAPSPVK